MAEYGPNLDEATPERAEQKAVLVEPAPTLVEPSPNLVERNRDLVNPAERRPNLAMPEPSIQPKVGRNQPRPARIQPKASTPDFRRGRVPRMRSTRIAAQHGAAFGLLRCVFDVPPCAGLQVLRGVWLRFVGRGPGPDLHVVRWIRRRGPHRHHGAGIHLVRLRRHRGQRQADDGVQAVGRGRRGVASDASGGPGTHKDFGDMFTTSSREPVARARGGARKVAASVAPVCVCVPPKGHSKGHGSQDAPGGARPRFQAENGAPPRAQ